MVSWAGVMTALCALVPGLITLVIALVADPADPTSVARWNSLEPRGDDVLFLGVLLFAVAVTYGRAGAFLRSGSSASWSRPPA